MYSVYAPFMAFGNKPVVEAAVAVASGVGICHGAGVEDLSENGVKDRRVGAVK